jgi:crotonobetaine/carnitine-CoA ligase
MEMFEVKHLLEEQDEVIVRRFEKLTIEIGNRPYLYYGEDQKEFTFHEFNQLTNAIAHNLQALGVQKGDVVPVFLKNSMAATFAMFSIWKTGALYCPINFSYKGKLLSYQINDSKAKVLITERKMVPLINEIIKDTGLETVIVYDPDPGDHDHDSEAAAVKVEKCSEILFKELEKGNITNLDVELHYYDPANIVYTSGTTGLPKGVLQSYRWMNQYTFYRRRFFDQDDVIYNDLPLYHVGGAFFNVIAATWAGAKVALWDRFSGTDFWNRIKKSEATSVLLLDVMIPWLMKDEETPDDRKNTVYKVYMQPLPQYHHKVAKRFGFDIVMAGYGQTESGQGAVGIIKELDEGQGTPPELIKGCSPQKVVEIGRALGVPIMEGSQPLAKGFMGKPSVLVEAAVLNERDEECEPGEVGQLAFRPRFPHSILEGYFNNSESTWNAFKNLWFHTGDACYKGSDGNFYFVDRMGGIIRVKGEFVSSYQVEDYINEHPKVDVSAVFPIPAEVGEEDDIVAYIVVKAGKEMEETEIRKWIQREMPKFMWPKYIRFVDELPRTPSSKIEKYKLKQELVKELGK